MSLDPMNCHLDDTVLREMNVRTDEERAYLSEIMHPNNPFNEQESEEATYSKEVGMMTVNTVETPRNIFCYVKRRNRTLSKTTRKEQEREERAHGEATKIIRRIDLATNIEYPKSASRISDNLECIIRTQTAELHLTSKERDLVERAINRLHAESIEIDNGSDKEMESDSDHEL